MKNYYYYIIIAASIIAASAFAFYIINQNNLELETDVEAEPPIIPGPVEIKPPKIENPYVLNSAQLAKWNKCIADETHSVLGIYPDICFTSDGLFARGPLK